MLVAEKHLWYHDFYKNPVDKLHNVLEMTFLDWKFSPLGREQKKHVGIVGIAHRKQRLEDLGVEEDDATARLEGRFSDAKEEESRPDEPYPAQVSPWNVKTAVTEFARDNPKVKPEALLEWANGIDEEEHAPGDKLVVQGGKFDGSWQWEHKFQAFLAKINSNGVLNNTSTTPPRKVVVLEDSHSAQHEAETDVGIPCPQANETTTDGSHTVEQGLCSSPTLTASSAIPEAAMVRHTRDSLDLILTPGISASTAQSLEDQSTHPLGPDVAIPCPQPNDSTADKRQTVEEGLWWSPTLTASSAIGIAAMRRVTQDSLDLILTGTAATTAQSLEDPCTHPLGPDVAIQCPQPNDSRADQRQTVEEGLWLSPTFTASPPIPEAAMLRHTQAYAPRCISDMVGGTCNRESFTSLMFCVGGGGHDVVAWHHGVEPLLLWMLDHFEVGICSVLPKACLEVFLKRAIEHQIRRRFKFRMSDKYVVQTEGVVDCDKWATLLFTPTVLMQSYYPDFGYRYLLFIDDTPTRFLHSLPGNVLYVPPGNMGGRNPATVGCVDDILSTWVHPMLEDLCVAISLALVCSVPHFMLSAKRPCEQRYVCSKLTELHGVIAQSGVDYKNELEHGWYAALSLSLLAQIQLMQSVVVFICGEDHNGPKRPLCLAKVKSLVPGRDTQHPDFANSFAHVIIQELDSTMPRGQPTWPMHVHKSKSDTYSSLKVGNELRWPIPPLACCDVARHWQITHPDHYTTFVPMATKVPPSQLERLRKLGNAADSQPNVPYDRL
ncbi:unnamed protein product [Calypogeia fissa]